MKALLASLLAVAVLAALALAPVATAQTGTAKTIEGKVMTVDPAGKSVTLDDGTKLMIPDSIQYSKADLKAGAAVKASYEVKDGQNVLTNLQISK
jgi:Cu/Ag efflux protein CusF